MTQRRKTKRDKKPRGNKKPKTKPPPPEEAIVVTRTQFARLISCPPDRVTKFIGEGMPGVVQTGSGRGHHTMIDIAAALPWVWQRRTNQVDHERGRLFRLQGDKLQVDLRHRAGELVEAVEVDARNAARTIAARERLLQLPGTALQHGIIATADQEDRLRELVDDALLELAQRGGYVVEP